MSAVDPLPLTITEPLAGVGRPRLLGLDDLLDGPGLEWLVEGFVPLGAVSLLTASENTGKTFVLLDLALSIVHGVPFLGRRTVKAGDVVWLAGEGHDALTDRVKAWREAHPEAVPVGKIRVPSGRTLFKGSQVDDIIGDLEDEGTRPLLVVVDTVSAVIPGADQNSTSAMTYVPDQAQRFVDRFGAAVVLAHHPPKGKPAESRGSNALEAAARAWLTLTGSTTSVLKLKVKANNNAAAGAELRIRFREVGPSGVVEELGATAASTPTMDGDTTATSDVDRGLRLRIEKAAHKHAGVTGKPLSRTKLKEMVGGTASTTIGEILAALEDPESPVSWHGDRVVCSCDECNGDPTG